MELFLGSSFQLENSEAKMSRTSSTAPILNVTRMRRSMGLFSQALKGKVRHEAKGHQRNWLSSLYNCVRPTVTKEKCNASI